MTKDYNCDECSWSYNAKYKLLFSAELLRMEWLNENLHKFFHSFIFLLVNIDIKNSRNLAAAAEVRFV